MVENTMALEDLVQVLQQASFISAVLAGFAVTLFIGLLPVAPERRVTPYAAGTALLAAALLGVATITGVSGVVSAILDPEMAAGPSQQSTVFQAYRWTIVSFLCGMVAFMLSLGFSGWVHSRRLGLVSSLIAAGTIGALGYFLLSVVQGI